MNGLMKEQIEKLNNYEGLLRHNYRHDIKKDKNGNAQLDENGDIILNSPDPILVVTDTRELEMEKLKHIRDLWNEFNQYTLNVFPQYVQINAALGLLEETEKNKISTFIKSVKEEFSSRKAAILSATTCDEVVQIARALYPENIKVNK